MARTAYVVYVVTGKGDSKTFLKLRSTCMWCDVSDQTPSEAHT
jgi:hypothetical protein